MSLFITFEGIEGCGKTTQAEMLKMHLEREGLSVLLTREPGGTELGEKIRKILLNRAEAFLSPLAELLLYLSCRAQLVETVIRPALESNTVVICDRFLDSTIAYQGYGKGLPMKMIEAMDKWTVGGLKPDLTFLLDCRVEEGLKRAWGRIKKMQDVKDKMKEDRYEREGITFHKKVREGYLKIASKEKRVKVIHADREASLIHEEICGIIDKLISKGN